MNNRKKQKQKQEMAEKKMKIKKKLEIAAACILAIAVLAMVVTNQVKSSNKVTFIETCNAHQSTYEPTNTDETYGVWTPDGIRFDSTTPDLTAYQYSEAGSDQIKVKWGEAEATLKINQQVNYIRWRPKHTSFIYARYEEDEDGGDFGACSLHYVEVAKTKGQLTLKEKALSTKQMINTDLGWSSDGKYYAYSEFWSLRIRNFETGREWWTDVINIGEGETMQKIVPGPFDLMGFTWLENDSKIFFRWKDHPYHDDVFNAEIDVQQFDLR